MDDDHVTTSRFKRIGRLAWLTARTTGDMLAGTARRKLGGGETGPEMQKAAERILGTLGELKGAALKLGQALAMDPDALPPEARKIVAKLLSQAPQRMPWEMVAEVVRKELGAHPDQLFASFEREPIGAASLGQVHGAVLPPELGGGHVVVKVQYPGVDKALEGDLANAGVLVRGVAMTGDSLDGRPYYEEVRASLMRELDYREEARQNADYLHAARAYPELCVPRVIPERTAQRVITLERLRGPSAMEWYEGDPDPAERYRVARLLIFAIWGPFFADRLIHADPHPGNFLVLPDGRLGVLDFGATKRLSEAFAATYRIFLDTQARNARRPDVGPLLEKAGFRFLGEDPEDGWDFCEKIAEIVERPSRAEGEYDFGADAMVQDVRALFARDPRTALAIKPPPEAVMFYRSAAGLAQDLRLFKVKGEFRSILLEIQARGAG